MGFRSDLPKGMRLLRRSPSLPMRNSFTLGLIFAAFCAPAFGIGVGDTLDQVIAEKGKPGGRIEGGGAQILQYPDVTVRLREGRVVSVEPAPKRATAPVAAPVATTPTPAAAPRPKAAAPAPAAGPRNTAPMAPAAWTANYTAALEKAKLEKRNVFLFFTGSDWCGWCMRLQKEILTTPEFMRYADEKLVLVELDFPNRKPIPPGVKLQNQNLARKFGIRGYPTVIVLNSEGKPVGKLGYMEGGPAPFVSELKKM
jgi:thiol-disulfide isomerase/thioredoxin